MAKLAINGGKPVSPGGIKPGWPIYDSSEKKALIEVLESGRWCNRGNPDGKVAQAEKAFAEFVGTKYAKAVSSGTTALELALRACDISYGDEVIVPAVTFLATASSVITSGAVAIFVDIDPDTYQISPDAIEAEITERTRAILPVHYGGYPADMDRIMEIARKHGLFVIEDCAEAHGTQWREKSVGTFGNFGCFSFQMAKTLTCGEGGAITYNNTTLEINCFSLSRKPENSNGEAVHYLPAGNWRMSEFAGAILLTQLSRLEKQIEARQKNAEYFTQELLKIEGLSSLKKDTRITRIGYFFMLSKYDASRWNDIPRDRFIEALKAEGVQCGTAHNDPQYLNPLFQQIKSAYLTVPGTDYSTVHCPEAERIYETEVVAMPNYVLMKKENVDIVLSAIHKLRNNIDELKSHHTQPKNNDSRGLKSTLQRFIG